MTMLCKDSTNHDEHDITSLIKHASCTHVFVNLLETTISFSVELCTHVLATNNT